MIIHDENSLLSRQRAVSISFRILQSIDLVNTFLKCSLTNNAFLLVYTLTKKKVWYEKFGDGDFANTNNGTYGGGGGTLTICPDVSKFYEPKHSKDSVLWVPFENT